MKPFFETLWEETDSSKVVLALENTEFIKQFTEKQQKNIKNFMEFILNDYFKKIRFDVLSRIKAHAEEKSKIKTGDVMLDSGLQLAFWHFGAPITDKKILNALSEVQKEEIFNKSVNVNLTKTNPTTKDDSEDIKYG